jgi:cytochrome oxidase Cu insertion factor (SCO1/SenC/PrrC family)
MRLLKSWPLTLGLAAIFFSLQACSSAESDDKQGSALESLAVRFGVMIPNERMPVPDFALENLEGQRVRLTDFRGKIVFLTFSTTW